MSSASVPRDFPRAIVKAIKALSEPERRKILTILRNGDASYTDLRERTGQTNGNLNAHLKSLEAAALIRNYVHAIPSSQHSSFYQLTNLATKMVDGIFAAFDPFYPPQEFTVTTSATFTTEVSYKVISGSASQSPEEQRKEIQEQLQRLIQR